MNKSFILLFTVVIFWGLAGSVLAAPLPLDSPCNPAGAAGGFSECTPPQTCQNVTVEFGFGTCTNPPSSGFGVKLTNPLCLAGDKCTTATATPESIAKCDDGKWRTDPSGFETLAQCCTEYNATAPASSCVNSFPQLIKQISDYIVGLISALVVIMIVWAGFLFVTSAGNPGKIDAAKKVLIFALVGAGIALASAGLIAVVTAVVGSPP